MCGRYYIDDDTAREIEKLIKEIDKKLNTSGGFKTGDIRPADTAPVIINQNNSLQLSWQRWGFKRPGANIIFNARSETVLEKVMFKDNVLKRRCIIPAKCFYEWDSYKTKYTFKHTSSPVLFMAGCYGNFSDEDRFVIITTRANVSISNIHDRMPLLLDSSEVSSWMLDDSKFSTLLSKTPHLLEKSTDYEQQVLLF